MENAEEVLRVLERYCQVKPKDIPKELEDYLGYVARTGDTVYRWNHLKLLFREKLVTVLRQFHETNPSIDDIPHYPNVDPFNYDGMTRVLLERLELFNAAPFTVQRLCELLVNPKKQYNRVDKYMRALEKNILVVSTVEPGRKTGESDNGDTLDSIVNGDISLDVNVEVGTENESFARLESTNEGFSFGKENSVKVSNNMLIEIEKTDNENPSTFQEEKKNLMKSPNVEFPTNDNDEETNVNNEIHFIKDEKFDEKDIRLGNNEKSLLDIPYDVSVAPVMYDVDGYLEQKNSDVIFDMKSQDDKANKAENDETSANTARPYPDSDVLSEKLLDSCHSVCIGNKLGKSDSQSQAIVDPASNLDAINTEISYQESNDDRTKTESQKCGYAFGAQMDKNGFIKVQVPTKIVENVTQSEGKSFSPPVQADLNTPLQSGTDKQSMQIKLQHLIQTPRSSYPNEIITLPETDLITATDSNKLDTSVMEIDELNQEEAMDH